MDIKKIINTKTLIWAGFLSIVYVLRHFFLIIFMTFLISYLMLNFLSFLKAKFIKNPSLITHKILTIVCFILLLSGIYFGSKFTFPRLTQQGQALLKKVSTFEDSPQKSLDNILRVTVGNWLFEQNYSEQESVNFIQAFDDFKNSKILPKEFDNFQKLAAKIESLAEKKLSKKFGSITASKEIIKSYRDNNKEKYIDTLRPYVTTGFSEYKNLTNLDESLFFKLLVHVDDINEFSSFYFNFIIPNLDENKKNELLKDNFQFLESQKLVTTWKQGEVAENLANTAQAKLLGFIGSLGNYLAGLLPILVTLPVQLTLSLMLSFFITFDINRLSAGALLLKNNARVGHIYDEIIPGLNRFASLIGRAFQAQGVIAIVNTILTYVVMQFLAIENSLFLSLIVFICSFIPVLGVVLSGAPICTVAIIQDGGSFTLALAVIAGILIIHFIETSILNPKIVGTFLHLHPVLVLVILALGEHFFGAWGLLLGLPVAVYLIRIVILGEGLPWEKNN
jgi:predicted PurR-regulated permease PerM